MGIERGRGFERRMDSMSVVEGFNDVMAKKYPPTDLGEFVERGLLAEADIEFDQKLVQKEEAKHTNNPDHLPLGKAAEYWFLELVKQRFADPVTGKPFEFQPTSKYDDFFNNTDVVGGIQLRPDAPVRMLGFQITVTEDPSEEYNKFQRTVETIKLPTPELPAIRYYLPYATESSAQPVGKVNLTKILVSLDKDKIYPTIEEFMDKRDGQGFSGNKVRDLDLKDHPAQFDVLRNIIEQVTGQLATVVERLEGRPIKQISPAELISRAKSQSDKSIDPKTRELIESQADILEYFTQIEK